MSESTLVVIIRVPNQNYDDQKFNYEADWTINRLKQQIKKDFPGHPECDKQRLIHSGKELQDSQLVQQVVHDNNCYIHLVCSGVPQSKIMPNKQAKPTLNKNISESQIQNSGAYRRHVGVSPQYNPYVQPMYHPSIPGLNMEMYNQWLQQYQQYMTSYMQQYSQAMNNQLPNSITSTPNPAATENVHMQQENNIQAQNVPQDNAPARANAQPAAGAGGFMQAEEEDIEGRDWLDAAFSLTRLGFLLSIFYYYSSTYRFIMTLLVFIGIYLYQMGMFNLHRIPANPVNEAQNNPPLTDDNNNQNSDDEADGDQSSNITPPPPGLLSTAWCFLRTFITSIVPQNPGVGAN